MAGHGEDPGTRWRNTPWIVEYFVTWHTIKTRYLYTWPMVLGSNIITWKWSIVRPVLCLSFTVAQLDLRNYNISAWKILRRFYRRKQKIMSWILLIIIILSERSPVVSIPLHFASSCLLLWKDSYLRLILASKNQLFLSGTVSRRSSNTPSRFTLQKLELMQWWAIWLLRFIRLEQT